MKGAFAGSFDPIHIGHLDIIERASKLFDELHVLIAYAQGKPYSLSLETRVDLVQKSVQHIKNVTVSPVTGLVVDYANKHGIQCLVRGLRIISDFEYEQSMDWHNHILAPHIETLCLMTRPHLRFISSRSLKELIRHGQNVKVWLPEPVFQYLKQNTLS